MTKSNVITWRILSSSQCNLAQPRARTNANGDLCPGGTSTRPTLGVFVERLTSSWPHSKLINSYKRSKCCTNFFPWSEPNATRCTSRRLSGAWSHRTYRHRSCSPRQQGTLSWTAPLYERVQRMLQGDKGVRCLVALNAVVSVAVLWRHRGGRQYVGHFTYRLGNTRNAQGCAEEAMFQLNQRRSICKIS